MKWVSPVEVAHRFVALHVAEGDCCVDATMGNGHDSLFLAEKVGASGKILALDVQPSALEQTWLKLKIAGVVDRVVLRNQGHQSLSSVLESLGWRSVRLVMFNLGYLPGSDKSVTTRSATTLTALETANKVLAKGGAISIVAYRGHAGGLDEYLAVENWVNQLSPKSFFTARYERWPIPGGQTPVFFWVKQR